MAMIPEFLMGLIQSFGYLGVFASSLLGSATILFPVPSFIIVAAAGAMMNPFLVAVAAALGSAIGELTGYAVGFGGRKLALIRKNKHLQSSFEMMEKWFEASLTTFGRRFRLHLGFVLIFIFAATPLPDDIIGLFCGAVKYDVRKFFLATLAGKFILSLVLAYAGFYGIDFIVKTLA